MYLFLISNGSVAERSKAADSSSVIVRCACSNHAGVIIFPSPSFFFVSIITLLPTKLIYDSSVTLVSHSSRNVPVSAEKTHLRYGCTYNGITPN